MTDLQFNRLLEKQETTNHLLEDIYDALDAIAENLILIRKKQDADRQDDGEAKKAFDDMLDNPMKKIDGILDCARRSFTQRTPEAVKLWADDYSERMVW